jgi:hypothetical protein
MSINVEVLGGSLMVQHYVEDVGRPDHLRLVSTSDLFTPTGRTKIGVVWDLSVKRVDDRTCEFTNTVHSSATPELLELLAAQGIPWDVFEPPGFRSRKLTTDRRRRCSQRASSVTP